MREKKKNKNRLKKNRVTCDKFIFSRHTTVRSV